MDRSQFVHIKTYKSAFKRAEKAEQERDALAEALYSIPEWDEHHKCLSCGGLEPDYVKRNDIHIYPKEHFGHTDNCKLQAALAMLDKHEDN